MILQFPEICQLWVNLRHDAGRLMANHRVTCWVDWEISNSGWTGVDLSRCYFEEPFLRLRDRPLLPRSDTVRDETAAWM